MAEASHRDYYTRRAGEARALAEASADAEIRRIHLDMAARYAELAATAPAEPIGKKRRGVRFNLM